MGGMERASCCHKREGEGLLSGFGDGEWGDYGVVVERSYGLVE